MSDKKDEQEKKPSVSNSKQELEKMEVEGADTAGGGLELSNRPAPKPEYQDQIVLDGRGNVEAYSEVTNDGRLVFRRETDAPTNMEAATIAQKGDEEEDQAPVVKKKKLIKKKKPGGSLGERGEINRDVLKRPRPPEVRRPAPAPVDSPLEAEPVTSTDEFIPVTPDVKPEPPQQKVTPPPVVAPVAPVAPKKQVPVYPKPMPVQEEPKEEEPVPVTNVEKYQHVLPRAEDREVELDGYAKEVADRISAARFKKSGSTQRQSADGEFGTIAGALEDAEQELEDVKKYAKKKLLKKKKPPGTSTSPSG